MAEIVVVRDQDAAGELAADSIVALIVVQAGCRARARDRLDPAGGVPGAGRGSPRRGSTCPTSAASRSTSTSGCPAGHPETYRAVITREVVEPLGLTPSLIHVPNGSLEGIEHAGADYEKAIAAAGGVDVQILGIGTDGHIGFNEPGSSFASLTRVKTLTEQTRQDNARFFDSEDDVPMHCITQGLGTILRARHLMLLAFGEGKAEAVAGAVEGPVSACNPGSAIQLHPHVTVLVDEAAASRPAQPRLLPLRLANKPAWQRL